MSPDDESATLRLVLIEITICVCSANSLHEAFLLITVPLRCAYFGHDHSKRGHGYGLIRLSDAGISRDKCANDGRHAVRWNGH